MVPFVLQLVRADMPAPILCRVTVCVETVSMNVSDTSFQSVPSTNRGPCLRSVHKPCVGKSCVRKYIGKDSFVSALLDGYVLLTTDRNSAVQDHPPLMFPTDSKN